MSERETHNFMSVDSFSQLPFIRPPSSREKPPVSGSAIRLFGIEFPHESSADEPTSEANPTQDQIAITTMTAAETAISNNNTGSGSGGGGGGENSRKFECHYCCRNFPTSQALGGHQNAHKRERQHAKRAHIQSAMAAAAHHHQQTASVSEGHVYGLLNYHRLSSVVPSATRFGLGHAFEPSSPSYYPSWTTTSINSNTSGARFHGHLGSVSQPINGNPLPGLWRVPAAVHGGVSIGMMHRDRTAPLPLLQGDDSRAFVGGGGAAGVVSTLVGSSSSSSSSSSPKSNRHGCELTPGAKDSVSLDLHL